MSDGGFLPLAGYFIIVFCTVEAVAMAALYGFARSGLETDRIAILGSKMGRFANRLGSADLSA